MAASARSVRYASPGISLPSSSGISLVATSTVFNVANGAPLLVDVEFGRGRTLYALSQGSFPTEPPFPDAADLGYTMVKDFPEAADWIARDCARYSTRNEGET